MSAFLGPIHHWLFKKILCVESRAFAIADGLIDNHAEEIRPIINDYGEKLEGHDLAELLGDSPIHSFLDGLIAKADVFEAQLVKAADSDFNKILEIVKKHGAKTAETALDEAGKDSIPIDQLSQYINDYVLEGMPCDPGAEFDNSNGEIRYGHRACNHLQNWSYTGADPEKLCQVANSWLEGLLTRLNGDANYSVIQTIASGANACEAHVKG